MNITTRLKKIEQKLGNRKKELVFVEEYEGYEGQYFIVKDGKNVEIKNLKKMFPDQQIIIMKSYSKPNI